MVIKRKENIENQRKKYFISCRIACHLLWVFVVPKQTFQSDFDLEMLVQMLDDPENMSRN